MTLVDTNVAMRTVRTVDPMYGIATAAVSALVSQGDLLRMFPQTVYEFWVVATRPTAQNGYGISPADCVKLVATLEAAFPVLPDPENLYDEWKALVAAHDCKGKVAHDARFVAAMKAHGITRLLTFNGPDFVRYPGVVVLDPATVAATS